MYSATALYGAGPLRTGQGAASAPSRMVGGGGGVPSPSAVSVASRTATVTRRGLASDPTAGLVALIGAAALLAIWST